MVTVNGDFLIERMRAADARWKESPKQHAHLTVIGRHSSSGTN